MKKQNLSSITKNFILFRSYSRLNPDTNTKESWKEICERNNNCLGLTGNLNDDQLDQLQDYQENFISIPAGRFLWIGGVDWFKNPKNYYAAYNCTGIELESTQDIKRVANLGMMGCGTGVSLETKFINKFPIVKSSINTEILNNIGDYFIEGNYIENTSVEETKEDEITIFVGDSREGWCNAIKEFIDLFYNEDKQINKIIVDLGFVRPKGYILRGFGGVSNPAKLGWMFSEVSKVMNRNLNQRLNAEDHCLILDSIALMTVAGSIRRVAGIRQFDSKEKNLKDNLWNIDQEGNWYIDPEKQQMIVANHTHVFHREPSYEEIKKSVSSQYYSGEGALQFAPEVVARANADCILTKEEKFHFLEKYKEAPEKAELFLRHLCLKNLKYIPPEEELHHRINRYLLNPCGEIASKDFLCNLSEIHLNRIDPLDFDTQYKAFQSGAWSTVVLLHQEFDDEKFQNSRELDPIIGVSFTGLFDFFVDLFGISWLRWWEAGRPDYGDFISTNLGKLSSENKPKELKNIVEDWAKDVTSLDSTLFKEVEAYYLNYWREIVEKNVATYCSEHEIQCPNRCTTVQPAGSKSLLTGASSGWAPPIGLRYIRRMSFAKEDPIAQVALEQGFSVVPNSTDIDENGKILKDIYDPDVTNWLIEVPVQVPWANLEGAEEINFNFPAISQLDFWSIIQNNYTGHNTSATILFEENEIETVTDWLHNNISNNLGYSSIALMGRCDNFPLMPFEEITREKYDEMIKPLIENNAFSEEDFLNKLNSKNLVPEENPGPLQCDSEKCFT